MGEKRKRAAVQLEELRRGDEKQSMAGFYQKLKVYAMRTTTRPSCSTLSLSVSTCSSSFSTRASTKQGRDLTQTRRKRGGRGEASASKRQQQRQDIFSSSRLVFARPLSLPLPLWGSQRSLWRFRSHAVGGALHAKALATGTEQSERADKEEEIKFDVVRVLKERGLLNDATNEEGIEAESKARRKLAVYCGFDPTADSLHLGNLLGIIVLSWFARAGHQVFALCGGATGSVGDPSGKSAERPMLDVATLNRNTECIGAQLNKLLTTRTKSVNEGGEAEEGGEEEEATNNSKEQQGDRVEVLNNLEWFENMTFLEFLRNVGKYARVGTMLNKDSVKSRMEASASSSSSSEGQESQQQSSGLSFTEFSYQLLQGYDFMHLYRTKDCRVQIGGSDQWGNITAGTDLIRRLCSQEEADSESAPAATPEDQTLEGLKDKDLSLAYGLTFPLLVGSDGKKFGKSEGGAIWLDGDKLSPYHMYQHLLRTPDSDVVKFLKMLTFLDLGKIQTLEAQMDPKHPDHQGPNACQKVLAAEVTLFVHGKQGLDEALKITEGLFESQLVSGNAPTAQLSDEEVIGAPVVDLLVKVGLQPSKSAVKRMIKGGAIRVNNRLIKDEEEIIAKEEVVDNRFLLLAAGKKNKKIVQLGRWID